MLKTINDKGETVTAIGAEGSDARIQCEYPALCERIDNFFVAHRKHYLNDQFVFDIARFCIQEKQHENKLTELLFRMKTCSDKKYPERKWNAEFFKALEFEWKGKEKELEERVLKLESETK